MPPQLDHTFLNGLVRAKQNRHWRIEQKCSLLENGGDPDVACQPERHLIAGIGDVIAAALHRKGAGIEVGRFLLNSTVGIAGFFDLAKEVDLVTPEEDFGQTLGFYGVKPGPYLVLPLLPPFTVRDFTGFFGDIALNPINWLVLPIIEVKGVPSVIAHKNRTTTTFIQLGGRVGEIINERSRNLEKFQGVEEATLDLYSAVRNAYLQKRAKAVKE